MSGQAIDFTKYAAAAPAPGAIDFTKYAAAPPAATPPQPSAFQRLGDSALSGAGVVSNEQGKNFFLHPLDTLRAMANQQGELGARAQKELANKDYVRGLTHGVEWLMPGMGPQLAKAGDQLDSGDIAGGVGTTLGVAAPLVAGIKAPAIADAAADAAANIADKLPAKGVVTAPIRYAARSAEAAINQKILPAKPLLRIMTPADEAEAVHLKIPGRDFGLPTAQPEPAPAPAAVAPPVAPAVEAGAPAARPIDFTKYAPAPAPLVPGTLKAIQAEAAPVAEAPPAVPATPKSVQSQLENALGAEPAKPLLKGVSLRNQAAVQKARTLADLSGSAKTAPPTSTDFTSQLQQSLDQANKGKVPADTTPAPSTVGDLPTQIKTSLAGKLPDGFTPVESSALKGYKYSPETREFESVTNSGSHYIHGDVSPEEAQAFEDADSKGKAWSKLKSQNPLVAKVVNGNRVATKPGGAKVGGEDLSSLLGESLKQAQMRKLSELQ
jgi:hypothetical protein